MDPDEVFTKVCSSRIICMENGASKFDDALSFLQMLIVHFRSCFSKADRAYHRCRPSHSVIPSEYV